VAEPTNNIAQGLVAFGGHSRTNIATQWTRH
jgi:hypothetical protein